ncbi:MAG: threonine dehydratase, partial [Bacteroidota bacterium]|nr:threonine dehydratase [Bacteroidota bacterium]
MLPTIQDISEAALRIKGLIHHTPVLTSSSLNKIFGSSIYFKCENMQRAGAFKFRGATNSVFSLSDQDASKGVATHSSGNFAQALALAAGIRGIKSFIVMPDSSPKAKTDAVAGYGGKIIFCESNLKAREETLEKVVSETGAVFLHPYNNFNVICGQGTAALELSDEIRELDIMMAPVGGGGLISGTAIAAKSIAPEIRVIASEPAGADDAKRSFDAGIIIPSVNPKTIADGLLTSLGSLTFPIIQKYVDDIVTVSDEAIIEAMKLIWSRMKIIIEPSAAVTVAAMLENKFDYRDSRIGIILSGG